MINFREFFLYIIIYSLLGWCCEVGYAYKNQRKFVNRGFLHGPICPIYGICTLTIIGILQSFNKNIFILFIIATIVISTIEYITGYLLEKVFRTKYWDYTEDPFNLHGRICLHFSLMWGMLAVLAVKVIHPFIVNTVTSLPLNYIVPIFIFIFSIFIIDIISTLLSLINIKKLLNNIQLNHYNFRNKSLEIFENLKYKK